MPLVSRPSPVVWRLLTKAERRALLVGDSSERDSEDIRYWQQATDAERGRTLHQLLTFAQRALDGQTPTSEGDLLFPGFPKRR